MAAAMNEEDVRGHLKTRSVCTTQNVEQAGETEMKRSGRAMCFNACLMQKSRINEIQRGAADTLPYVTRGF